jgi:protein TonB
MEAKKSPKADLEKKKGLFLEIGLVATLAIILLAFSIKSYDQEEIEQVQTAVVDIVDIDVQITDPNEPPPPPPEPEVQAPEFNVVDNDQVIKDEFLPVDVGDNENAAQDAYTAPPEEEPEQAIKEEEIFISVEKMPEFPGGETELYKYLNKNLKYPDIAKEQNLQGRVYITFVVEKDGSIANPKVARDIGGGCGEEALRVVRNMPKWTPGKQRTQTVRVQYTLPVIFQLE